MKINKRLLVAILVLISIIAVVAAYFISLPKDAEPKETSEETATATAETKITEEKEPEPYVVKTVRIGATGDVLIHTPMLKTASQLSPDYDFNYFYPRIKDVYSSYDYMIANLEVPLGGPEAGPYDGYPSFNTPDTLADALKNAGVDMLLTANNHANDCGRNGLLRTCQVTREKGFDVIGTRLSEAEANYKVVDFGGLKVGMICYTYSSTPSEGRKALNGRTLAQDITNLVNTFDYNKLDLFYADAQKAIAEMKAQGADYNIFFMHWGNEYHFKSANSYQTQMAETLCNLGVDFIVGGHPHVIQPFSTLTSADGSHKTYCLYSCGNSISNQRRELMDSEPTGHTEDGIIYEIGFEIWSTGEIKLVDIDLLPTWVNMFYQDGKRLYEIVPLDVSVADWSIYGCDVAKAKASYNRTMELVGSGLNEARASLGFTPVPTHID